MSELSSSALRDFDQLREACARIDLDDWVLLELTGEDRKGWLQGQATNDVKSLTDGSSRSFCLCEATGHLLAAFDARALPNRIVMTTARERTDEVLSRIERMTIMEDVVGTLVEREVVSVQGPTATRELGELLLLPTLDAGISEYEGVEVWALRSNRTGLGGWDIWLPKGTGFKDRFPLVAKEAYEVARIEAGIPKWGADMGKRTLPPELGSVFEARHVSYNKGCYTGQEVLMRLHSRGHTNKTWVGLVSATPMAVGQSVTLRGKEIGTITSAAISPDYGPIAAGTLRNEGTEESEIVLIDGVEAEVRRMPILRFD